MILLAVGTQFGFDRLVKAVDMAIDTGLVEEEVFAQIGPGIYKPKNMEHVMSLEKNEFDKKVNSCQAFISHAGIGNISMALKLNKPILVLPRQKKYGEVVNDHQVDTARKFESLGHILAAYDENELPEKIKLLKDFNLKPRIPNRQGVIDRISSFINRIQESNI